MFFEEKRRIPEQMLAYWNRLRGARRWPAAGDVKSVNAAELWDDIFIIKVREEGGKRKFDYIYQGRAVHGMFSSAVLSLKDGLDQKFETVCASRDYLQDEQVYTNRHGYRIKYRLMVLPLGPDDETIDHLLCGMRHTAEERGLMF